MTIALIILALAVPLTSMVTGYFAFKGVQYGLRWRQETDKGLSPTIDPIVQQKPANDATPSPNDLLDEWINGPKEERERR